MLILAAIIVMTSVPGIAALADDYNENNGYSEVFSDATQAAKVLPAPKVEAASAVVLDMQSKRVLYEKNAEVRRPMASTTKIMTAIIAIENGRLDEIVTVSKRAASIRGSTIGLREGEQYSLRELLYGLLLSSGNDAALAIAEHFGGTVEAFAEMMNRKAQELGLVNTSFKNPHGLDTDGHYTTAHELALLTAYALSNPDFSKIVGTKVSAITKHSLQNTNEMLFAYPGADGVKTGYTGQAGRCLVTSATRDKWRIISVVLNCSSRDRRAQNSRSILDYAFTNYKPQTLIQQGDFVRDIAVEKGIYDGVRLRATGGITLPLKQEEIAALEKRVEIPEKLRAPVQQGTVVGKVSFLVNGAVIAETEVKTAADVRRKNFWDYLGDVVLTWISRVRMV